MLEERLPSVHTLTGLKALSELNLCIFVGEDGLVCTDDALHLTGLTALTKLDLSNFAWGVGDVAAAALACGLTNLQHLDLRDYGLKTMGVVPVIARQLTRLTYLDLSGDCNLSCNRLMLLTSIKTLESFEAAVGCRNVHAAWLDLTFGP